MMKTLVASAEPPPRSERVRLLEALRQLQKKATREVAQAEVAQR